MVISGVFTEGVVPWQSFKRGKRGGYICTVNIYSETQYLQMNSDWQSWTVCKLETELLVSNMASSVFFGVCNLYNSTPDIKILENFIKKRIAKPRND